MLSEYSITRKRIEERDVRDVIEILETDGILETTGVKLSRNDITMLLRCCGRFMVKTHPSVRTELLDKLWKLLQGSSLKLGVAHYNARLIAMLENRQPFLVHEELAAMDASGIQANRATYQVMIDKLLREGDLLIANQIKTHMEEVGLPVTNMVYNAFIRAHIEKGNFEEAEKLKEIMVDTGFHVDARYYTAVVEAYGARGDLDSIQQLIYDAAQRNVKLDVNELKEGVLSLCRNGHEDKAKQLIALMPVDGDYNQSLMNCMHEAIVLGCNEVAIEAYRKGDSAFPSRSADSILVAQIAQGVPADGVLRSLAELRKMGRTDADLEEVTRMAMNVGSAEQMMEYIEKMHEEGKPIWAHFFRPPLLRYCRERNADGLFSTLKRLLEISGDPEQAFYYLIADAYYLESQEFSDVVARLRSIGFNDDDLKRYKLYYLLSKGNYKEALDFYRREKQPLQRPQINFFIDEMLPKCGDYIGAIEFLSVHYPKPPRDLYSKLLFTMLGDRNLQLETLAEALQLYLDKVLLIKNSEEEFTRLRKEMRWQGIPDDMIEKIRMLQHDLKSQTARSLSSGPAKKRLIRASDAKELQELCDRGEREKAVKMKKVLEFQGFGLTLGLLYNFGKMEAKLNNLDEAMKYKNILDTQSDSFDYSKLVMKIADRLISNHRIDEALHMLEQYSENHRIRQDGAAKMDVASIINECGRRYSFAETKNVVDVLLKGYIDKEGPEYVSRALINTYANKHNAEEILEAVEYCRVTFQQIPPVKNAMAEFIKQGDGENLQKVVDLVVSYLGENAALHYLITTLVSCDKLAEARKLVQTPGLRANMGLLSRHCFLLQRTNMIEVLENLVDVTKDMNGLDREEMLFQLIRGLCLNKQTEKAADVLDVYKKEGLQPSERTLQYLNTALKNDKFVNLPSGFSQTERRSRRYPIEILTKYGTDANVDEAIGQLTLSDVLFVMEKAPHLLTTYKDYLKKSDDWLMKNKLFGVYILEGDFESARMLLQTNASLREKLGSTALIIKLGKWKRVETLEKMMDLLQSMEKELSSGTYCQSMQRIDVQLSKIAVNKEDINAFTKIYEEAGAQNVSRTHMITKNALKLFEKRGVEFPWEMHGPIPETEVRETR